MKRRRRLKVPALDLFPFLSIFLCIMGILAFLETLMATASGKASKIEIKPGKFLQQATPYQIFCLPDGLVILPPVSEIKALAATLKSPKDRQRVTAIAEKRDKVLAGYNPHERHKGRLLSDEEISALLEEMVEINNIAKNNDSLYEETLLFGIYPAGSAHFHNFRRVMYDTRFEGLKKGYEILDSDWQFVIPSAAGQTAEGAL